MPPRSPLVVAQPPAIGAFANAAGGWRYHLNAWQHRQTLWAPYTAEVAEIFAVWAPDCRELAVVGPSAGYHLPAEFLQRFQTVWAIEPDPLARWMLRRRFGQVAWRMVRDDYFTPHGKLGWTDNLARLFSDFDGCALLFANFLGQLVALYPLAVAREQADGSLQPTSVFGHYLKALNGHLHGRQWCSLHDRLSSPLPPAAPLPMDLPRSLATAELAAAVWPPGAAMTDHLTGQIGADLPRKLLCWQRKPHMHHLIEAVWQGPQPPP